DKIRTPYSQTINFSISRELPGAFVFEAAYVARLGRKVMLNSDLAMPLDLFDPASGMDYFTAASTLAELGFAGKALSPIPNIPFWENLFPGYAKPGMSATQAIYRIYSQSSGSGPDYTTSLFNIDVGNIDVGCKPCSKFGPFAFFNPQFSNLNALRSLMSTSY